MRFNMYNKEYGQCLMLYRLQLLLSPELLPPSKLLINSLTVCFFSVPGGAYKENKTGIDFVCSLFHCLHSSVWQ